VPVLAPKQNRIVVPALLELVPKMIRAREEAGASSFAQLARYLDAAAYDRLCDLVFSALTRALPGLTRAEFDEMPIDTLELVQAVRVIALQAGLLKHE
jgi:hypothetical protein